MPPKGITTYYYRGLVERGTGGPSYRWAEGWSENSAEGLPLYPWMTRHECQKEAQRNDTQAVFVRAENQRR